MKCFIINILIFIIKVHLLLTPQQVGELSIKGIAYNLLCLKQVDGDQVPDALNSSAIISLQGKQCLKMKGPRLNKTAEDRATVIYADDNRLNINILEPMAKLQVFYYLYYTYNINIVYVFCINFSDYLAIHFSYFFNSKIDNFSEFCRNFLNLFFSFSTQKIKTSVLRY